MEQLDNIHNLSIAELKKILSDNHVAETNITEKSDLIELVVNTLLSTLMIHQLEQESETEYTESLEVSQSIETSRKTKEQSERREIIDKQEQEYADAVKQDSYANAVQQESYADALQQESYELSPQSLREKRLQYYNKD